ncbi:MAG: LamG-like jellyroll fold domain-containing protein [Phycisphaerales bacterium]
MQNRHKTAQLFLIAAAAIWLPAESKAFSPYSDAVMSSNPAGYWRFEQTDGSILNEAPGGDDGDVLGNVTRGVASATEFLGSAVAFSEGAVVVPASNATDVSPTYTLEFWAKANQLTSPAHIVSMGRDINAGSLNFAMYDNQPYFVRAGLRLNIGNPGVLAGGDWVDAEPQLPEWNHFALVLDEPNDFAGIYVNGELVDGGPWPQAFVGASHPVNIGRHSIDGFEYYFFGLVDEVAIYQRALPESEIVQHYEAAFDCSADLNDDGEISLNDLNVVLAFFGQDSDNAQVADTNDDGVIDLADLNAVLGAFGQACP